MDIDLFQYLRVQRTSPIPISHQISQQLSWLISIGKVHAGDRLPPIRTAAQRLGIHMHTVRAAYRHLQEMGCVSSRPGAGTIVLSCQPHIHRAESPMTVGMHIGVMLPDLDAVHSQLLAGMESSLRGEGFSMLLEIVGYDPASADLGFDRLIKLGVQGIVNVTTGFSPACISRLGNNELQMTPPILFVNGPPSLCSGIHVNIAGIAFQAALHLIDHGHSSLGLITLPRECYFGHAIYRGFMDGLRARTAGTGQAFIRTVTRLDADAGYQAALQFCRSALRPTAVFAASDRLAAGAAQAYLEQGLRIPEDVAIIAYNDSDQAGFTRPGITAFNLHSDEIGFQAAQMMIRSLESQEAVTPENIVFPVDMIKRRSCGCADD